MKIAGIIKSSLIDYPGKASTVVFLGGCNFRCGYCHNPELILCKEASDSHGSHIPREEIDTEDFLDFIESRRRFLDGVCISGGEPTLNKDLPGFIGRIKQKGFAIKLDTNGTNPVMLKELIDGKLVDYVAMDIKGPSDKYRQIVNGAVNLGDIKASSRLLIGAQGAEGFSFEFRTTVCKEQLTENDLKRMIEEYPGATKWFLQRFHNPGNILDNGGSYTAYTQDEMEELGNTLCVSVR